MGLVRTVTCLGGATDVHHHGVTGLQDPIGHLRVRAGAVGSGRDDDEVDPRVTLADDRLGDVSAHRRLGATNTEPLRHMGVHPVDGSTGAAQGLDFGCALAHPQLTQHGAGENLPRVGHRSTKRQHLLGPHTVVQGYRGDPAEDSGDQRHRVIGLLPGHDFYVQPGH